jgi:ribosome biogenesis GTPase / thiamine phosphate phosphatase
VVASYRRGYQVCLDDGARLACITRGRKLEVACGDRVLLQLDGGDRGVITSVEARSSLLYRADHFKQKTLAANVTQIVVVVSAEPPFSDELLTRCLVAAECAGLKILIVCNKADLEQSAHAWQALAAYQNLGYRRLALSARSDCAPLRALLQDEASVLVGQSGMGKSTIINTLLPQSNVATREISHALNAGKHTTTAAVWYVLDHASSIIDTPGLQSFGLAHLSVAQLTHAFPEFRDQAGHCRFSNCAHQSEPDCQLLRAVHLGSATEKRLSLLRLLIAENTSHRHWQ